MFSHQRQDYPQMRNEHPSTYFVQDRTNREELNRLQVFDHLLTNSMGGVLPEQPDPTIFPRILDVGCGTGGWLIELAKTVPTCTRLVGVDVSRTLVEYARAQAVAAGVGDRVEFHAMDALRMLEFPTHFFDLVNHRSATSWLRTWDWPKLLQEYQRVCRLDGVVRITEPSLRVVSSSPALTRLCEMAVMAFHRAGHLAVPHGEDILNTLKDLFYRHGLFEVRTQDHLVDCHASASTWQPFVENVTLGFRTILPFLRKWTAVPDDYEALYQQMLREIQQPDFLGMVSLLTVWGVNLS